MMRTSFSHLTFLSWIEQQIRDPRLSTLRLSRLDTARNSRRLTLLTGLLGLALAAPVSHAEYFVVVGSFLDSDTAMSELHRRSDRSGNTLRIAVTTVDDQTYHRLISGPFVNPRTALAEQMNWQSVGVSDAWVVQLRGVPERRRPDLNRGLDIAKH